MKKINKLTSLIAAAGLLAVLAMSAASFWAFSRLGKAAAVRKHSSEVINKAGDLLSGLLDAETGQRGYLITNDEVFLTPYIEERSGITKQMEKLIRLADTADGRSRLEALTPLVKLKMAYFSRNIGLNRTRDTAAVLANVKSSQGKPLMDAIRAEMEKFIEAEKSVLAKNEAKFQYDMRSMFAVIISSSVMTLLFALFFAYFVYRESQNRLRNMVQQETQELLGVQEETNKQLQQVNLSLQISEERFSVTINSIGDAVMAVDKEGRITLLNPTAEKLTGWTHAQAKGMPGDEIFHIINEKTRQPCISPLKETLVQGTKQGLINHTLLISRDGTERSIADSCAPIRGRDGGIAGAVMVFRDVTELTEIELGMEKTRKQMEIIKKSEDEAREYSESIINTVREPLIALDQELRVVSVSRSFYDVFKVKPGETVGHLIYDLGNKQWNIPKLRELLETILPQKATFDNYEVEHDFTGIGRRTMLLNARQIQRASGKERIILLAIEDITERREIENGLEKTRKELVVIKKTADEAGEFAESIINTVREPLISLDQDLRVVMVSRSFYEVFKVKPEETLGRLIYDLGNKQWNIPKLRELLETILPKKATFENYEVEHDFAGLGRRIMLLNARQIKRASGKERIILLAIEDITERREIETGLEKAQNELKELTTELKRTARAKSEFLANMSHELRTPLNSINGFSEILYDETFGAINSKQKQYVNYILTSGKHLLLLINQVLDMSKVEAGKMKLMLSELPMTQLLNEFSMLVADMVSKKKLHMALEIAKDLPDIEADELKVKEIIYNLLSNAVKFTPEGGNIGMRARLKGPEIEITVWDSGIGIAPENMEKIFEGFFRVDTPYSRVTEGTGLGLPLSKKMVELHGGKLSVKSEGLDKGTSVIFSLPVKVRSAA